MKIGDPWEYKLHWGWASVFGAHTWTDASPMNGGCKSFCLTVSYNYQSHNCDPYPELGTFYAKNSVCLETLKKGDQYDSFYPYANYSFGDGLQHTFEGYIAGNNLQVTHNNSETAVYENLPYFETDGTSQTCSKYYIFDAPTEPYYYYGKAPRGFVKTKCYYFKIYEGDQLIHNYVPVKRNQDNVYGLYDTVAKEFLTSPNGVSLSCGND